MSTNSNSGIGGYDNASTSHNTTGTSNSQGGVVDKVLSYVPGLSPTSSRNQASGTTDATSEPAFGANVGPGSSSHSYTGTGSHGLGSSTGVGAGSDTFGSTQNTTSGPHSSNLANQADPRVDSGSSALGGSSGREGYVPAPTLNPHDEERARVVADRAVGPTGTSVGSGLGHEHGHGSGVGSGVGVGSGAGVGSGIGHEHSRHEHGHGSGVGSGAALGAGAGAASGLGHDSSHGSGVGLDSTREHGVGHHGSTHGSGVGSGAGLGSESSRLGSDSLTDHHKTDRAVAGQSEGATAEEAQASATPRHHEGQHHSGTPAKRENKDAIPTAGGIKLGEKHWGESDIIPENPKPRNENISSSSGQPDRKYLPDERSL